MTIAVETAYLRGYADQIDGNCDNALAEMASYVQAHCVDFAGLSGILNAAEPSLSSLGDSMLDLIAAAQRGLRLTAEGLRDSAREYDETDFLAAERQWLAMPGAEVPWDWRESNVATSATANTGGAVLAMMAPTYTPEGKEALDYLKGIFGTVNDVIEKLTGYDLIGTAMPVLIGDWGALKRIADAYGEIESAWTAVAADLSSGMDVLSAHWDSTRSGLLGASRAFDFHLRSRWITALQSLAQMADTMQQMVESLAAQYEHTVKGLLYTLTFYLAKLQKTAGKIMAATSWVKLATALYSFVSSIYDLVVDGVTLAVEQVEMFIEGFEMIAAGTVLMRNRMNGDFDVLKAG